MNKENKKIEIGDNLLMVLITAICLIAGLIAGYIDKM